MGVAQDEFFNPDHILSDAEMTDYNSLSLTGIQRFLEEQGSGLAGGTYTDYLGVRRSAASIIWQAAQESQINPKVLLTTLQKEQSLIEDPSPTQRQIDRAMGYRCPDSGSCHPNTLDFGKQVDGAAWQFQQYLTRPQDWFFKAGETYAVDNRYIIRPQTTATAGLYNYTPHYSGNQSFWRIWNRYWAREYPEGTLLKANDGPNVWLLQFGTRRPITSFSVLVSRFDPKKIITVSRSDVERYPEGPQIKFSNYSILSLPDQRLFLLVDDQLREIDPEAFRKLGYHPEEVVPVEETDFAGYTPGPKITAESLYPTGILLQNSETGGVYYVENSTKHPIFSREIMRSRFPSLTLRQVLPVEFEQYADGTPAQFQDGELVRIEGQSSVYVISEGLRRWIPTEEVFTGLGYRWENIVTTNAAAVELHPLGDDVSF